MPSTGLRLVVMRPGDSVRAPGISPPHHLATYLVAQWPSYPAWTGLPLSPHMTDYGHSGAFHVKRRRIGADWSRTEAEYLIPSLSP